MPSLVGGRGHKRSTDGSVGSARLRALARKSQFLAAAMELLEETDDIEFTVQSIVERAELSLRSFYQQFNGKDELLLALFRELVTQVTDNLAAEVEGLDDPYERLEAYIRSFLQRARNSGPFSGRAWTIYQMRLAAEHPGDYAKAIARQVEVVAAIIEHGVGQGSFRSDLPVMAMTLLINSTLVTVAQVDVIDANASDGQRVADDVWSWCRSALAPGAAQLDRASSPQA